MTLGFLGYPGGFGHWLIHVDHLPNLVINWMIGVFLTCVVLGAILRPLARRGRDLVRREWDAHLHNQEKLIAQEAVHTAQVRLLQQSNQQLHAELVRHTAALEKLEPPA